MIVLHRFLENVSKKVWKSDFSSVAKGDGEAMAERNKRLSRQKRQAKPNWHCNFCTFDQLKYCNFCIFSYFNYCNFVFDIRRVGKSTIAEEFAKTNYRSWIIVD